MSGIIGSAGSKSGVIGTTELDYEEGTWTPTWTADLGGVSEESIAVNAAYTVSKYVKVGKLVYWSFRMYIQDSSLTGKVTIGALPFSGDTGVNTVFHDLRTDALTGSLSGYPSGLLNTSSTFVITDWVPGTSEGAGDWADHLDGDCWMRMSGTYMTT